MIDTTGAADTDAAGQRRRWPRVPDNPVRSSVAAALVLFVIFGLPGFMNVYYTGYMTLAAIYAVVALGLGVLVGRVGLFSLGQGAVLADRRLDRGAPAVRHRSAVSCRADRSRPCHDADRYRDRAARAADARAVPGADHADAGWRHHGHRGHGELPQRRRRLYRVRRQFRAHSADQAAVDSPAPTRRTSGSPSWWPWSCSRSSSCTCAPGPAGPGRRSGRASPRRWRPAST